MLSNKFQKKHKLQLKEFYTTQQEVAGEWCVGIRPKLMASTYKVGFFSMISLKHARAQIFLPATLLLFSVMRIAAELYYDL